MLGMGYGKSFIDGESGTTGLGIRERLTALPDVALKSLPADRRRAPAARRTIMAVTKAAKVTVLPTMPR